MATRGGKREGAGRKPGPVPKKKITTYVPAEHEEEIKKKFVKISEAYEDKCKREL